MVETIKILIAEDHTIVQAGLRSLLERESDMEVVGLAADGREAVALAADLRPGVVVMDITLPVLNGVDATRQIREMLPDTAVLGLSMHSDPDHIIQMLRAGASGYLLKDCATDDLVRAIRQVATGAVFLGTGIARVVVDGYLRRKGISRGAPDDLLTAREREVLQLVAEGMTTKEIASTLDISGKTVESHRANLMEKLGASGVPDLTRHAIRRGLTTVDR